MNLTNVAVWGLGGHAIKRILPALASTDKIRLVGVCSRDSNVVKKYKKKWSCYGWHNPKEMLNHDEVDVVFISTPIGVHFSCIEQALKSGKHVWCEKPLTCNYKETKYLVSLAEKLKKGLIESFMYLHHTQFHRAKQLINESGQVHSVVCKFGIPNLEDPGFRNDPKLCGGAFWDVASYTISAILSLFPNQHIEILFSEVRQKKDFSVDTEGRALLRISKGTTAYLEWGVGVAYRNELDVWTVEGSFFTEKIFSKPKYFKPKFLVSDLNGNVTEEHCEQREQFVEMFHDFVQLIVDDQEMASEREVILERAKLMDDILNFSKN